MDPFTIARTAISLASACQSLYLFLKKVRDGDPTIIGLRKEIRELETTVEAVRSVADSSLVTQLVARQWRGVHRTLRECEKTVQELIAIMGRPDSTLRDDLIQRLWKQMKISGFKAEDIAALQSQMASNRQTLNLSLQVIILNAVSTNESQLRRLLAENVTLGSKIDEIAYGIEHLRTRAPANDAAPGLRIPIVTSESQEIGQDLQDSLSLAREAVLRTPPTTLVPLPADESNLATPALNPSDVELVENWLHNSLTTPNDDVPIDCISLTPNISFEQIGEAVDEKSTTVTVVETLSEERFGNDDDESLIEFHTIRNMRHLALRAYKRPNYDEAETLFKEVMRRSELKYGSYYSWKEEAQELLVKTYCIQSKWDLAEEIWAPVVDSLKKAIGRPHPSFYESATFLMRIHCAAGHRDKAARLQADLPENYWNEACFEIMEMSRMTRQDAAKRLKTGDLSRMLQDGDRRNWQEIEDGIKEGGLTGCGMRFNLVHLFAEKGHEAPMRLVLSLEGLARNLDGVDSRGMTALHLATRNGHLNIVRLLVVKRADIEARTQDEFGESALILAAVNDNENILQFLIDNKADVGGCDAFRWTALHRAASVGAIKAVKSLLANGADIGKSGNHGWTPLHCASSNGRATIVQLLLDEGANPSAKADDNTTPLSLARGTEAFPVFQSQRTPSPSPSLARRLTRRIY